MSKQKKQTKFKNFLDKVKKTLPNIAKDVANVGVKLATGNYLGAIGELGQVLTNKAESDEKANDLLYEFELQKMEFALEQQKLELADKQRATDLYKHDNQLQKILSLTFLILYIVLSFVLLYGLYKVSIDGVELDNYVVGFVSALHGGMSTKVNTIVDFFFGASTGDKNKPEENAKD